MSSFFAILNGTKELVKKAERVTDLENALAVSPEFTLLADPLSDRLFYAQKNGLQSGWIVSGIGIHSYPNLRVMTSIDWDGLLSSDSPNTEFLNGHFAGISYTQNEAAFFTDSVGMRSLYYARHGESILLSTRFDWLIPFSGKSINWNRFGAHWLAINAFSGECFVDGISRLRGTAHFDFHSNHFEIEQKPWLPSKQQINVEGFIKQLSSSIFEGRQNLWLGLSGGLDSRVLFAMLSDLDTPIKTYTFGGIGHPDEKIVQQLLRYTESDHLTMPYEPSIFSLEKLAQHSRRTMMNGSIPDVLTHALYKKQGQQSEASIDGGIGEIGRRRYLKKVELRAGKAIINKDINQLLPYFLAPKSDFFTEEITKKMKTGMKDDLATEIAAMPDVASLGLPNWLDLFSIRTRLTNIAGLGQELVDDTHFHIMPFVQVDFLSGILAMPVHERTNARLFRTLIKKHKPAFTKIPLVKGDEQYPYWMKDMTATIWNKIQAKIKTGYSNTLVPGALLVNKSEIRDLFASKSVKESGLYDMDKVNDLLSSFYELNDYTFATSLNWMLTFELFRKSLSDAY